MPPNVDNNTSNGGIVANSKVEKANADNNNNASDNVTDEAQLLASLDASIQDQDVYEDQVIRDATHQLAPTLNGIGFAPLAALAPSYNALRPDQFNSSDIAHFFKVLQNVRSKLHDKDFKNLPVDEQNILYMKEQMVLHFLQNVAHIPFDEMPVNRLKEQQQEAARSQEEISKKDHDVMDEDGRSAKKQKLNKDSNKFAQSTPALVSTLSSPARRARVPVMKHKRNEGSTAVEDEELKERRNHLRMLREERKKRRLARQREIAGFVDTSDNSEEEFDDTETTENDQIIDDSNNNNTNDENIEGSAQVNTEHLTDTTMNSSATCPLCQQAVTVEDTNGDIDAALSKHMSQCQMQRRSTRVTRNSLRTAALIPTASAPNTRTTTKYSGLKNSTKVNTTMSNKEKNVVKRSGKVKVRVPVVYESNAKDDIDEGTYEDRVDDWIVNGLSRMKNMKERDLGEVPPGAEEYDGGLYIPAWINNRLFEYQRFALRWMWNLHQRGAGGIVGDEMGLGKTVQVSSYLGALTASRKIRSVLIISPATMLQHWLNELAIWAPGIRRVLIHLSGESDGAARSITDSLLVSLANWLKHVRRERVNEAIDDEDWETSEEHIFCGTGYAVVTTYENLRRNADIYIEHNWSYVVLDEAQKIRNPDADVTLACKRIRTPHRLALSGTPIQNDLKELWSLFDFVFPGRLGTLPAFEQEFATVIKRGGYSNASPMQVQLAYRCALALRDLVNPYLLRRQKKEVKEVSRMPGKTEHVLFCRLSKRQRAMYEAYLKSDDVVKAVRGSNQLLAAITVLRKICNHPDLVCDPDQASFESFLDNGTNVTKAIGNDDDDDDDDSSVMTEEGFDESFIERSGKLEVLSKILPLWYKQGHRVLIFCQWQKMLNIIHSFTMMKGWKFGRLDGKTNVASRQRLVDNFNSDLSYFGMLCTTRTGGVGLNLTGANRIILYDPDWNPQTDAQARERAWRFGQEKEVTVYRLITAGTVEEKIYQRQIFKTALSNKILQDPRQRRLFSQRDLKDLFTLKADAGSVRSGGDGVTDTTVVTKGIGLLNPGENVEVDNDENLDNTETLKGVMQSKGLAGIFDHNYLEPDSTRKTATAREMEERAKLVAKKAMEALQTSTDNTDRFAPTWTGSTETQQQRFGGVKSAVGGRFSSSALINSLKKTNTVVAQNNDEVLSAEETEKYTDLLKQIKDYVRRHRPTTDDLLAHFANVSNYDVAIFKRLLKSVAQVQKGRWQVLQ